MSMVSALAIRELTDAVDPRPGVVVRLFERLREQSTPWLLDSETSEGANARFSFVGADPYLVMRAWGRHCRFETRRAVVPGSEVGTREVEGDALDLAIDAIPHLGDVDRVAAMFDRVPPLLAGAVGYFGYELGQSCEPVHLSARDDFSLPDLLLLYNDRIAVIDHQLARVFAIGLGFAGCESDANARAEQASIELERTFVTRAPCDAGTTRKLSTPAARWVLDRDPPPDAEESLGSEHYAEAVEAVRSEIAAGNVYQANLTQRIDLNAPDCDGGNQSEIGWSLHRALREINPAPFAAYFSLPEVEIVSSSPERFLRLDPDRRVESRPIKGTRRRGASPEEDALLAKELEASPKDRAENLMIVDLVRNDLGRVCETGSVEVPDLMAIEPYATVHQMVSTVRGKLRADRDRADLLRATFPPGSMTGAPKIAAMEIIDRIEPVRRGIYSGAIGYLDARGGLDLSVVIRTLLVREGRVHMHGGGAVVSDSEPEAEYREALDKVRALLAALACCE